VLKKLADMLATKGRASFLGERSLGHIDAGAKSSQLIISAIILQSSVIQSHLHKLDPPTLLDL
jgi:dihydroxyacetone kinase